MEGVNKESFNNKKLNKKSQSLQKQEDPIDIKEIKKKLIDPRYISKKLNPEGRKKIANDVLNQRERLRSIKRDLEDKKKLLDELIWKVNELTKSLNILEKNVDNLKRISLDDEIQKQKTLQINLIEQELEKNNQIIKELEEKIKSLIQMRLEIKIPQKISDYYEEISHLPLNQEEKRKFLKPEILKQLTLNEYIYLWKRLKPHYFSYLMPQGLKDNFDNSFYIGDIGEFIDGFKKILKDDKMLRPFLATTWGLLLRDEETIKKFLEKEIFSKSRSVEEAKKNLIDMFEGNFSNSSLYPEKTALRFAHETVHNFDDPYDREEKNEIFVIFPTDFIVSQYYYSLGIANDFDALVWTGDLNNPGISIDAGIVFIPADDLVDPETGFKYASKIENGKRIPLINEDLTKKFVDWFNSIFDQLEFKKLWRLYIETFDKNLETKSSDSNFGSNYLESIFNYLLTQLKELGFDNEAAQRLKDEVFKTLHILTYTNPNRELTKEEVSKINVEQILIIKRANFQKPKNPITSKEYWEKYFDTYPEFKPKHIVFYKGQNPISAVSNFLLENRIKYSKREAFKKYQNISTDIFDDEDKSLGFNDHYIKDYVVKKVPSTREERESSVVWQGYEDFIKMAEKIIEEHYSG